MDALPPSWRGSLVMMDHLYGYVSGVAGREMAWHGKQVIHGRGGGGVFGHHPQDTENAKTRVCRKFVESETSNLCTEEAPDTGGTLPNEMRKVGALSFTLSPRRLSCFIFSWRTQQAAPILRTCIVFGVCADEIYTLHT